MRRIRRLRPRGARSLLLLALTLASLTGVAVVGVAQPAYQEADVKAVLIARVVGFIRWAEDAGAAGAERPLSLAVLGDAALAARLSALHLGSSGQERALSVRALDTDVLDKPCDVLFIGRSQSARLERILAALGEARTLTIADTPGAASRGVAINLYAEERRMRLEINPGALKRARLTASYQLMNLARIVPGAGGTP